MVVAQRGMDHDESVAAALKCRDPASIEMVIETHGTRLLRSATLLCGNETLAQDLVQDTFVEAYRAIHRFRGQSSLYTWLHAILLNLIHRHFRDSKRFVSQNDISLPELGATEDGSSALDLEFASTELARALGRLSGAHREALVLRYYEQMKMPEMARHLGVSTGTVKSRLHYAIQELQKNLPAELNLFGAGGTKEKK